VSYEALQKWTCIDSATGEDLAEEVRSYFIPDFSNWKSHDDFERAFARLLADLKASA
jgi:L-rhamnose isomerase